MEEEENLRELIKDQILEEKEVDEGILDAYNEMSEEFKEAISFSNYYSFHRKKLEEEAIKRGEENNPKFTINIKEELELDPKEEEKRLCKRCCKEERRHDDKDYCNDCILSLQDEAVPKIKQIKKQLLEDPKFQKLTSEKKAIAYAKQKYEPDMEINKFIAIRSLAIDTYALLDLNKSTF